jgi:selenocysteine lyase/cysteine desulfurase
MKEIDCGIMPALTKNLYARLLSNPRIDLLYPQKTYDLDRLSGICSFTIENLTAGDIADALAHHNIFVRAGRHCAGVTESVRISLQCYNIPEEIDHTCDLLERLAQSAL